MSNAKLKLQKKWQLVLLVSVLFLVVLVAQDIIREIVVFNRNIEILESEFERDLKEDVNELVRYVENNFSIVYSNIIDLSYDHAEEETSILVYSANTVQSLLSEESLSSVQDSIVELVQTYNQDDIMHIYSVYDTSGYIHYNGFTNTISYDDVMDSKDALNRPFVASMIDDIIESESKDTSGLYYSGDVDSIEQYAVYCSEIDGTNLIVAGFISVSTYSEIAKQESIDALEDVYNESENAVYILSGDGEILYHQNTSAIGLTVEDDDYPVWQTTLEQIYDFVESDQEGFLEYTFYSNYQNGVLEDKIAYVTYIEEWDIIVGASSSFATYQVLLEQYVRDNYQTVLWIKVPAYLIILCLGVMIVYFIKKNIDVSTELLIEEERLYRTFADMTSEIIMITDKQGRIIFTNRKGTDIIYGKRVIEDDVYFDQILVEEDGYFILYGVQEDLFVKYITEPIVYNNSEADLYIIVNVTDKIQTKKQLEALSMRDDLTDLANRRMLIQDYNNIVLPHVKSNGTFHLAMIDLDDFKQANDLHGHTFGDEVLQQIAGIFKEHMNDRVKIYRIGGDEFAMLLMDMSKKDIASFLSNLQQEIGTYDYNKDVSIGFSGGVVEIEISSKKRRFSDFYDRADKLLYKSKDLGKNTINF
jgi:diguanylate cyclase (GGDEF)-like protein